MKPFYPTFDEGRERAEQRGDEYQYGAVATDLAAVPLDQRITNLPYGVLQFNNVMDTNGCASRGPHNILECKLDYFYDHGMHPALKKWFDDQGYRVNGKFALCDAFTEILSGTTPRGNSLKAPVDTIYRYGVIPAALIPLKDNMTWEEYMNPARITQAHKDLGQEFLRRIRLAYEQVPMTQFGEAIQDDLLDVAIHAYGEKVDGVYQPSDEPFNHVVARVDNDIHVFDDYDPSLKVLSRNYKFFDWGYSLSITTQNPYPNETVALFEVLQRYGLLAFFAEALKRLLATPQTSPNSAPEASVSNADPEPAPQPVKPVQSNLERLAAEARSWLGKDASPLNRAPQELSCAEGVVNVVNSAFPGTLDPSIVGTDQLFEALKKSPRFKGVLDPQPGTIVVSPKTATVHGHTGIYIAPDSIASNDSRDGKWRENYTRQSWRNTFIKGRGLKGDLFNAV